MEKHAQEILTAITTSDSLEKTSLQNIRVIQKNLVYVIGIPQKYADENLLKKHEFFGQFGQIKKFVINKRNTSNLSTEANESTASAYITYAEQSSATRCIMECDESLIDTNKIIRCTYGTTKYCSFYLKNIVCQNNECMYLHEKGNDNDSLTKDEMNLNKHKLHTFEGRNKNRLRMGKKCDYIEALNTLFQFKDTKFYDEPDVISFEPIDM